MSTADILYKVSEHLYNWMDGVGVGHLCMFLYINITTKLYFLNLINRNSCYLCTSDTIEETANIFPFKTDIFGVCVMA